MKQMYWEQFLLQPGNMTVHKMTFDIIPLHGHKLHLQLTLLSLQQDGEDSWTMRGAGCRQGIRMLCLCMKSCGGTASVVAGGTKVWMRRNGHQREMESSFRGGRHAHTCTGCLHWAGTLHADAFQRSRWAHQIRIHVFTLDFSLPKSVHVSQDSCALSWYVKTGDSLASQQGI